MCTNSIIIIIFYLTEFVRVNNGGEREKQLETNSKCSGGRGQRGSENSVHYECDMHRLPINLYTGLLFKFCMSGILKFIFITLKKKKFYKYKNKMHVDR